MKRQHCAVLAICTTLCSFAFGTAFAAAPQPGTLRMSLASSTITLGEPLILRYTVTNSEDRRVVVSIDTTYNDKWLTMQLLDALGHPVQATPNLTLGTRNRPSSGVALDSKDHFTGFVVPSQSFRIMQPGLYRLDVSVHLGYVRDEDNSEQSEDQQSFSFPITVKAKDSKHLHSVAEGLSGTVLHETDVVKFQTAIKALFSMDDPECLSVWRELATDPKLDASHAVDVIKELANAKSVGATDILAEMQTVAPERWQRTGLDPLNALENMRRTAGPELKQHINELLVAAGVDLNHVPYGSVN